MLVLAALLLAACASPPPADPYCNFPPGAQLAFSGESSLRALGLDQLGPVEAHDQVGMIYVTANQLVHEAQYAGNGPSRMFCGVYPEGQVVAGVIGWVPYDWQLPSPVPGG